MLSSRGLGAIRPYGMLHALLDHNEFAMINDFKFAFRQWLKSPGLTTVAILTLAIGMGTCTTTFSLVNAVLLRPFTFHEPGRLVWIQQGTAEEVGIEKSLDWETLPEPNQCLAAVNVIDWQERAKSFENIAGFEAYFEFNRYVWAGRENPERLRGITVSQEFLPTLGVQLLLGRNFTDEECQENGPKATIVSHAFWKNRLSADPQILGKPLHLNGEPATVVGVLPANSSLDAVFSAGVNEELLMPYSLAAQRLENGNSVFAIGRLKPDVTLAQAQEEMALLSVSLLREHPERAEFMSASGPNLTLIDDHVRGVFQRAFLLLAGAVLLVWLIACINLSNLLLARAEARNQEFSVRAALGASRWRLLRQTMAESLVLAAAGCVLGMILSVLIIGILAKLPIVNLPLLQTASLDGRTLFFALVMAFVSALICGAFPAWRRWFGDPGRALVASGTRGNTGQSGSLVRRTLVISEIALSCLLLVGAGLLTRSFFKVMDAEVGFESEQLHAWQLSKKRDFLSAEARDLYFDGLVDRIQSVPGVRAAGISDSVPMGIERRFAVRAQNDPNPNAEAIISTVRVVDHRVMQTMQTPLLQGRYFERGDTDSSEKVVIVSETLARQLWPQQDPLGQIALVRLRQSAYTVVGVVADVAHGMEEAPKPGVYLCSRQVSLNLMNDPHLFIRSEGQQASLVTNVRAAISAYDQTLPTNEFTSIEQLVDRASAPRKLITGILTSFSTMSLLLAALGLYGLIAYSIRQRTREIGIRFAIGARKLQVLWLVVRDVLKLCLTGMVIGVFGAIFLTQLLQSLLYEISPADPVTYLAAVGLLLAVAMLAAVLPARRAAAIEPVEALRTH